MANRFKTFVTVVGITLVALGARRIANEFIDTRYQGKLEEIYKNRGVRYDGENLADAAKKGLEHGLTPGEIEKLAEFGKTPDTQLSVSDIIWRYKNPISQERLRQLKENPYELSQIDYRTELQLLRARDAINNNPTLRQKLNGTYKWDVTVPFVKTFAREVYNKERIGEIESNKPEYRREPLGNTNPHDFLPAVEKRDTLRIGRNARTKTPNNTKRDFDTRRRMGPEEER